MTFVYRQADRWYIVIYLFVFLLAAMGGSEGDDMIESPDRIRP